MKLFHRTSVEAAREIQRTGRMVSRENTGEVFLSNRMRGHGEGYGPAVVVVDAPRTELVLDDEFPDGEKHYRVHARHINPSRIMRVVIPNEGKTVAKPPKVNTNPVAGAYAAPGERIIEFSDARGKGTGGLVSLVDTGEELVVRVYRMDAGVQVSHDVTPSSPRVVALAGVNLTVVYDGEATRVRCTKTDTCEFSWPLYAGQESTDAERSAATMREALEHATTYVHQS